jgi:hypothetical protein
VSVVDARDGRRIFAAAALVYLAFLDPVIGTSATSVSLDAALSVVEDGRWAVTDRHRAVSGDVDVARAGGAEVPATPPGLALLALAPVAGWRAVGGPMTLPALHVVLTVALGVTASALAAVQVAALAGWLGASRRACIAAALVFAFGTPAFVFGTHLQKEGIAALAVAASVRLALGRGGGGRTAAAGLVAGGAALLTYPAGLIVPVVAVLAGVRREWMAAVLVLAAAAIPLGALAGYNTWLFGAPWRFGYGAMLVLPAGARAARFTWPSTRTLLDLLVHPRGGLLLYAPFLLLAAPGLRSAWRAGRRWEAGATVAFGAALWLVTAAWLSTFAPLANGTIYLFAAAPLLAAFAALALDGPHRRATAALAGTSVALTYLIVQAGHIADARPLVYALKTFVTGTGMGVLFKETLPRALGLATLHGEVARGAVTFAGARHLAAGQAWALVLGQALMLTLNVAVLAVVGLVVRRLWSVPVAAPAPAVASAATR